MSEVHCSNCDYVSYTFEDSLDLALNVANSNDTSSSGQHIATLYSCLKDFTMQHTVEGYACEKCKKKDTSMKRTIIWEQPEVLVVQFKRFVYDMYGDRQAVKDKVSFPLDEMSLDFFTHGNSNGKAYLLFRISFFLSFSLIFDF